MCLQQSDSQNINEPNRHEYCLSFDPKNYKVITIYNSMITQMMLRELKQEERGGEFFHFHCIAKKGIYLYSEQ